MKIKKAVFSDLPEIVAVQKLAFYKVGVFYNNFRLQPLLTTIGELEDSFSEYLYLKAILQDRIIGSARAKKINGACMIEKVFIHPEHQRKGIGKVLVREIEDLFQDVDTFQLHTGKNTPGNWVFYQKLGYKITAEKEATEYWPVMVLMEKIRIKKG